ncbi:MAG: T9SS type A sorting domain-containing protein [Flavobacteriales bacterium]|nr:T9SS type A sorting domain-containing protein [Flavobacteriales bacterium]
MKSAILQLLLCMPLGAAAQQDWVWQERADMPMPTSNNAVCAAVVGGAEKVYSFGGITTGLDIAAIHREAFEYDVLSDAWAVLPSVPDTSGKIASAASVVNGVAYVIGGYHVLNGPPYERSSNKVHRLDLSTGTWLPDGAPVPIPIDDHVQAVWRDSLIYVVSGWSNTTNVNAVQIYDPASDAWTTGTSVPNTTLYKVFGASGTIIGDTIVYYGGASTSVDFPAQDHIRKGVIDPVAPGVISWSAAQATSRPSYRAGCGIYAGVPYWVGGSAVSYNYDAVAYNGSGVVAPVAEIVVPGPGGSGLVEIPADVALMDLRGLGVLQAGSFHVCGGIGTDAEVLSTNWVVSPVVAVHPLDRGTVTIHPNPTRGILHIDAGSGGEQLVEVLDALGRVVLRTISIGPVRTVDASGLTPGQYLLKLSGAGAVKQIRFWLVN